MDEAVIIPVSAIIPTANRSAVLQKTLSSLFKQSHLPAELIIIDASDDDQIKKIFSGKNIRGIEVHHYRAVTKGAASQRSQGVDVAKNSYVLFMDDDIELEPECVKLIYQKLLEDASAGAVNAMIINQHYRQPGKITALMYLFMNGRKLHSYAGKLIGPCWNLLPEDNDNLPDYPECEWLNITCTMYRREALPDPVFPHLFKNYSLLEDVWLSAFVAKKWKLYNARQAKIFHNSQKSSHKSNKKELSAMELENRHYIMVNVLQRCSFSDYLKLCLFEFFQIVSGGNLFSWQTWNGKIKALAILKKNAKSTDRYNL